MARVRLLCEASPRGGSMSNKELIIDVLGERALLLPRGCLFLMPHSATFRFLISKTFGCRMPA